LGCSELLQTTTGILRSSLEEALAASRSDLQSTVEELESSNEELRLELLDWVKKDRPDLVDRFLLMTGFVDQKIAAQTSRCPVVQKPFEIEALRRAIRETLAASS